MKVKGWYEDATNNSAANTIWLKVWTKGSSRSLRVVRVTVGYEPKLMASKDKLNKPRQRDVGADSADEMMQRMLSEAEGSHETGRERVSKGESQKGSGLLDALLPVGPPLSLAPKEPLNVVGTPREGVARRTQRTEHETPEVKRVVVKGESQSGETPREPGSHRTQPGAVRSGVSEHATREATGKGRGSGSETRGIGPNEMTVTQTHEGNPLGDWISAPREGEQWVSPLGGVEHYYIGEPAVGNGRGLDVPPRMGDVVNPFWSQERQREALAGVGVTRSGYDVGVLGQVGSSQSTPQKYGQIEMDPVELFRLRCLRDAEERFRKGLLYMENGGELGTRRVASGVEGGSMESQSSYVTATEGPEHFVPPPPPGPPPPSPPKMEGKSELGVGDQKPPPPPIVPPFPVQNLNLPKISGGNGSNLGALGENPTESLRSVDLPRLCDESTGLQFGDWLSIIDSMMGDLSYSSGEWWTFVRRAVDQCYQTWLVSSPLERLRLKPCVDTRALAWPRTERRALSMLLNAIPESIKDDANRKLTTDQVLYKLCVTFQPGGALERTKILQSLTDSKCGNHIQDMLDWIRLWRRQVERAQEIGVSLPDGLVMLGALSKCTDFLSGKSPQVAYRLNMVRQQLNLDQQPTLSSILIFSEHLQAEAEELVLSGVSKGVSNVRAAAMGLSTDVPPIPPGLSPEDLGNKPSPPKKGACKYWNGDKGCNRGDLCKFFHASLDPQSGRCFNCSAKGHTKAECPLKGNANDGKPESKKKVAKSSKSQGKGKSTKGSGKTESNVGESGNQLGLNRESDDRKSQGSGGDKGNENGQDNVEGLISEATSLLKSLTPQTKAIRLKRVVPTEGPTGLLDGGATHALRRGNPQELANSETVLVELAHGSVELKQHPLTGTILTDHAVEPIVPLRGLIDLGFVIKWGSQGCEIKHSSRGTSNCWLRNGCPVVSEKHALGLIQDIENMETAKRIPNEVQGPTPSEVEKWWSEKFPEVPKRVWGYMRGQGEEPNGNNLQWNRAQRRRHAQAKALIIHLFAGECSKEWVSGWPHGVEVTTVDVRDGQNLHGSATWSYLWKLAGSGRVIGIFGGPPCRTVSRLLERQPGTPRLRGRDGSDRFGFEHLTETQQQKTDSDTALYLKQLGLYIHAEESWDEKYWTNGKHVRSRVGFLLESPQDPKTYLANGEGDQSASFWAWQETMNFLGKYQDQGMTVIQFDQGLFGHPRKKPTGCMTNLPDMGELDGCRTGSCEGSLAENLDERLHQTASWSLWAPGFRRAVRASLSMLLEWHGISTPKLSKSLGLEQWKQHIIQGHQPYRRDCRTCVINMAGAKPHRRRENPGSSAWTMSVDLVHLPTARDLATKRVVKYGLVATALVPVFETPPKDGNGGSDGNDESIETVDPDWGEGIEEKDFSLEGDDDEEPQKDQEEGDPKDPEEIPKKEDFGNVLGVGEEEELGEIQYDPTSEEECDLKEDADKNPPNCHPNCDVREVIEKLAQPLKVRHVTLMEPVESRNVHHVMQAMDKVLTRMRFLGISIVRIHSDRAKELLSKRFKSWITQRNLIQTFTAGDDPQSNGHCESEVHQLKRRTRLLLHVASQGNTHWPQAMRYATEERLRNQLSQLGCPVQKMLPYQSDVLVKRKRWHDKGNLLAPPFVEAKLLCPSPDMTVGWLVQTVGENHVMHAREAILPDPLSENARIQLEEETKPGKPRYRLWGKQSPPGQLPMKLPPLPRVSRGGEPLSDVEKLMKEEMDFQKELEEEFEKMLGEEPGLLVLENSEGLNEQDGENGQIEIDGENDQIEIDGENDQIEIDGENGQIEIDGENGQNGDGKQLKGVTVTQETKSRSGGESVGAVAKTESWESLDLYLGWMHQNTNRFLQDLMDVVPTNRLLRELCGSQIEWLTRERETLEETMETVNGIREGKTIRLCSSQLVEEPHKRLGEVLQTVTVPLNEVRAEIGEWKESMMKEYNSLVNETKAIEPINLSDLDQERVEFVPGKLVTVRKAGPNGGKKKCRAVVCGNLLQGNLDPPPGSPYASGADGVLIRAALNYAVERRWGIATTDIRTAFLHAPRPRLGDSREVIVVPPKILVDGGVCQPQERWRVHNALYGFTSSPAHWAAHRDRMMGTFEWVCQGVAYVLKQSEEGNLWKIMKRSNENGSNENGDLSCEGHVIVYVDDIMVMADDQVRHSFFERLQKEWKCSDIETVNPDDWVRFCGFELKWSEKGEGLMVGQKSYTLDLLKRHPDVSPKHYPMPKGEVVGIEEENPSVDDIRRAQAWTGELLWLSGRSRPDISYAVSCMGRGVLKRPKWVQQIGKHVLGFLKNTTEVCLLYQPCRKDHGVYGTLQVPRHERLLEAFADISYAPEGDRSHQGLIICAAGSPIQWEATRQAFYTMSTSESELVGYCEATTMLKSAEALMKVLHGPLKNDAEGFEKIIYGDNTSALSILMNPDGGWRTRHLRLRSSCLRELLKGDSEGWKLDIKEGPIYRRTC